MAAVVAVACGLGVAGCASNDAEPADPPAAAPPATSAPTATSIPSDAPPTGRPVVPERLTFTGKTVDGRAFDAATLAGKPVVFWFWAPWCSKCRADARHVTATAQKHTGKVTVVGVAGLSEDVASMRDFVASTRTGAMTQLADPAGSIWKRFRVTVQDSYVLIAADGSVVHTGVLTTSQLAARVDKLAG